MFKFSSYLFIFSLLVVSSVSATESVTRPSKVLFSYRTADKADCRYLFAVYGSQQLMLRESAELETCTNLFSAKGMVNTMVKFGDVYLVSTPFFKNIVTNSVEDRAFKTSKTFQLYQDYNQVLSFGLNYGIRNLNPGVVLFTNGQFSGLSPFGPFKVIASVSSFDNYRPSGIEVAYVEQKTQKAYSYTNQLTYVKGNSSDFPKRIQSFYINGPTRRLALDVEILNYVKDCEPFNFESVLLAFTSPNPKE